jgi:hypothetical protein
MSTERFADYNTVPRQTIEEQRREEVRTGLVTGSLALAILTLAGIVAYAGELSIASVIAIPSVAPALISGYSFSEARRLRKKNINK